MPQGDPNKLGDAYVELKLGMDALRADVSKAEAELKKVTERLEEVADNTDKTARASGGWASGLQGVWNTYNAIVGTMRTAFDAAESLRKAIVHTNEDVEAMLENIQRLPSALDRARATAAQIAKLRMEQGDTQDADEYSAPIGKTYLVLRNLAKYGRVTTTGAIDEEVAQLERDYRGNVGQAIGMASQRYNRSIYNANVTADLQAASVTGGMADLSENIKRQNERLFLNGNPRP